MGKFVSLGSHTNRESADSKLGGSCFGISGQKSDVIDYICYSFSCFFLENGQKQRWNGHITSSSGLPHIFLSSAKAGVSTVQGGGTVWSCRFLFQPPDLT